MQYYPISKQDFGVIRSEGFVYVDKTEFVYRLAARSGQYFLSRPRRFGKSLLISTLAELFQGDRSNFKGLWIEKYLPNIEQLPVFYITFNALSYKQLGLEKAIAQELRLIANQKGIQLTQEGNPGMFKEIIENLSKRQKIVILIDEYDKPIIDYLDDIPQAIAHRDILKAFYSVIKGLEAHIHLLFITGVSKFSKVSIFSDLNHLDDITFEKEYATVTGFTQTEIKEYFHERISGIATQMNLSIEETYRLIRRNYNGYSWDGERYLYNPFSMLNFLKKSSFDNFWFETGTPTFLVKFIKKHRPPDSLEGVVVHKGTFNKFDLENMDVVAVMFQTGYLTIKKAEGSGMDAWLTLGYPNEEVRFSFEHDLLSHFANLPSTSVSNQLYYLRKSLENLDAKGFFEQLKSFFASIPYEESPPPGKNALPLWEGHFHALTFLLLKVMGLDVQAEVASAKGKTDVVVMMPGCVWVIEFKLGSAASAMKQIKLQGYAQPYLGGGKPVLLLGLGFNSGIRNVKSWVSERAS